MAGNEGSFPAFSILSPKKEESDIVGCHVITET